jgi:parallel beta-helix repeat protein
MGDDAVNVHGFYYSVKKVIDKYTVEARVCVNTQDQQRDDPEVGDCVEFIQQDSLAAFAQSRIERLEFDPKTSNFKITFMSPLPDNLGIENLIANTTRTALLTFRGCQVKDNRARGLLVQTRGAVIEDNVFDHCTGTGIHVNTAMGWYESIGTRDVFIRRNRFIGCGYGPGTYNEASGICVGTECKIPAVGIHKNIIIENNEIFGHDMTGIYVSCTDQAIIRDNRISQCEHSIAMASVNHIEISNNKNADNACKVLLGDECHHIKIDGEFAGDRSESDQGVKTGIPDHGVCKRID